MSLRISWELAQSPRRIPSEKGDILHLELLCLFRFISAGFSSVFTNSQQKVERNKCQVSHCLLEWCRMWLSANVCQEFRYIRFYRELLFRRRILLPPSIHHEADWED